MTLEFFLDIDPANTTNYFLNVFRNRVIVRGIFDDRARQLHAEPEDTATKRGPSPQPPAVSIDATQAIHTSPESSTTANRVRLDTERSTNAEPDASVPSTSVLISAKAQEFQNLHDQEKKLLIKHGICITVLN
jgi:hypothetical protein